MLQKSKIEQPKNLAKAGAGFDSVAKIVSFYTLIETCKMNDVDSQTWLADVLARLPDHPANNVAICPGIGRRTNSPRPPSLPNITVGF